METVTKEASIEPGSILFIDEDHLLQGAGQAGSSTEKYHGVALDEDALRAAVEWSVRALPDFRLPDKALDLVNQACAAVRFWTLTPHVEESGREAPTTDWGGTPKPRCCCETQQARYSRGAGGDRGGGGGAMRD